VLSAGVGQGAISRRPQPLLCPRPPAAGVSPPPLRGAVRCPASPLPRS